MKKVLILGAGPIGIAYAIMLSKHAEVTLVEGRSREDCCKPFGRSINLVLTKKAWDTFKVLGVEEKVRQIVVPMQGRMIHDRLSLDSQTFEIRYGSIPGQTLDSVSRARLNHIMLEEAELYKNINIHYGMNCSNFDLEKRVINFTNGNSLYLDHFDLVIASDGAGSAARESLRKQDLIHASRNFLNYGYIEIDVPSNNGEHLLPKQFLHIWPLGKMMCIALPNPNGSFTGGVFAPITGENSFEEIKTTGAEKYFYKNFPVLMDLIPNFLDQYKDKEPSRLSEVRCGQWSYGNLVLVGDAAHAITPFLGQGMNFGLLLARKFVSLLIENPVANAIGQYETIAKPEANLVANWSLENFHEMCDTNDCALRLRKDIEGKLAKEFPEKFACFHTMVSFCNLTYSEIRGELERQNKQFSEVLQLPDLYEQWSTTHWKAIQRLMLSPFDSFYKIEVPGYK